MTDSEFRSRMAKIGPDKQVVTGVRLVLSNLIVRAYERAAAYAEISISSTISWLLRRLGSAASLRYNAPFVHNGGSSE